MMDSYYDQIAGSYGELHGEEQKRKLAIISQFIPPSARILDVGCGNGLSEMLGNVVGLDPSIMLLKQAKIPAIMGVGEALPFRDCSFDVVISLTALHNFSDFRKGIAEMRRVAKKQVIIGVLRKAKSFREIEGCIRENVVVEGKIEDAMDCIFVCRKEKVLLSRQQNL